MSAPEQSDEVPVRRPRRELVEAEIYEQATRLFAERGFAGTSLQDIADAMGMTRPGALLLRQEQGRAARAAGHGDHRGARRRGRGDRGARPRRRREAPRARPPASPRARRDHAARFRLVIRSESELPAGPRERPRGRQAPACSTASSRVVDQGVRSGEFRPRPVRTTALALHRDVQLDRVVVPLRRLAVRRRDRRPDGRDGGRAGRRRRPTGRRRPRAPTTRPPLWTCCARTSTTWNASSRHSTSKD